MGTIDFKDIVERKIGDNLSIKFSWPRTGATFTYKYSLNGGETYTTGDQTIIEFTPEGGPNGEYEIPYDSSERPSKGGIACYLLDDGTDKGTIYVNVKKVATSSDNYTDFGPKRVKTKEMEIEQFDPVTIQKADGMKNNTRPVFSNAIFQVAQPKYPYTENPND